MLTGILTAALASPFRCPSPSGHSLPASFIGSWSVGLGSSRYGASSNTLWTSLGVDTQADTSFCILDAFVSPNNARRAFVTIGSEANGGANRDVGCALLDLSGTPDVVEFALELDISKCPLSQGLNYSGWEAGPPSHPLACPAATVDVPKMLLGVGSMAPLGYKFESFLQLSQNAVTLVNRGALVTTWCPVDVQPATAFGVWQIKFSNSEIMEKVEPFSPGIGCAWFYPIIQDPNTSSLSYVWGTVTCPSSFDNPVSIPYNYTS